MNVDKPERPLIGKKDYFRLSREQGLPNRCPILSRCARRAWTFHLTRCKEGLSHRVDGPDEPVVPMVGEDGYWIGGVNNFVVGGTCPEVGLFDSSRFFLGLGGYATTKGQYDKYMDPKYQVLETGHFSECAEYAHDVYQAASRTNAAKHTQGHPMTNNTFNVGSIQGCAVSMGGDAHNSGTTEFSIYPEPARKQIQSELDGLDRAIQAVSLEESERQKVLLKIADVKAAPSRDNVKALVEGLKTVGEIATCAAPFLTAIARLAGFS